MHKPLDVIKLAEEVNADMSHCDDLIAQGQELFSPHPTKAGFLIKRTNSGTEIGVLIDGKFTAVDDKP
ncbi:MAG: hypothetical protein LAT53_11965 [Idiomarina sp.]|nr:hypothetical protein [Idiomarina sp.]